MNDFSSEIIQPTFLIKKDRAQRNIANIQTKCKISDTQFRPHFKTHQSNIVGTWFEELGINKICVSSINMASQFIDVGWEDISIVFTFNRREIEKLNTLLTKAKIQILVEDLDTVDFLESNVNGEICVFIKIDVGYHRTGISEDQILEIKKIADKLNSSNKLKFEGLLSHFGNTYQSKGAKQVNEIYKNGLNSLQNIRKQLGPKYDQIKLSVGDTPSASLVDNYGDVYEMRAGNLVFYDWMQYTIGSCSLEQIAAIMLCPVVAKHPERKEIVIHGGAVHFSKEKLDHYGAICDISKGFSTTPLEGNFLKSLSQEHGIVSCTDDYYNQIEVGEIVGIIPIHSCLTANLMKENTQVI